MKRVIGAFLLLVLFLPIWGQGQDTTRYTWNPTTGNWDYLSRHNAVNDSTINYGSNNTLSADTLNGVVGHGNSITVDRSMAFDNMLR